MVLTWLLYGLAWSLPVLGVVVAIGSLDLRTLLANLEDQNQLEQQVSVAVTEAVKDSLLDRLRNLP